MLQDGFFSGVVLKAMRIGYGFRFSARATYSGRFLSPIRQNFSYRIAGIEFLG